MVTYCGLNIEFKFSRIPYAKLTTDISSPFKHRMSLAVYVSLCGFQQPAFSGSHSFVGGQVRDVRVSASATGMTGWLCILIIVYF